MDKKMRNTLIAAGMGVGVAAAFALTYSYSIGRLMKVALDREAPKAKERESARLSGSSMMSEAMELLAEKAAELEKNDFTTVEIAGHDGTKLVGHLYIPKEPKRLIIAMHGWRSSWSKDFGAISGFWHKNGCCVLYAEQRGQGSSGGDYMGFGLLERYDCYQWAKWADKQFGRQLPIYLGGISMGATTILMTSGFDLPESVKGIIADCGFTSPYAIWKHVAESNLHLPFGLYGSVADDLCRRKINIGANDYSCTEALKSCRVPVLFIHGTDDRFVPVEMTFENYKACDSEKRLFVVPGAEHGMSYFIDRDGYESTVKDFWNSYDR